jgi:hypothetical protein
MADVLELAKTPAVSAKLLIADLHTIPDSKHAAKAAAYRTEHTIWEIRALRFMTGGKDFCVASHHVFGNSEEEQNRKYWLTFDHPDCLAFFSLWPSHGREYIAPVDAQRSIISEWKKWYQSVGEKFAYHSLDPDKPEKWSW